MEALFTRGHNGGYGPNFQQENAPPDTGMIRRSAGRIMADTGLLKRMGAAGMLTTYLSLSGLTHTILMKMAYKRTITFPLTPPKGWLARIRMRGKLLLTEPLIKLPLIFHQWADDQHFVYRIDEKEGIAAGYQGLDSEVLKDDHALATRAREWMLQMKTVLDKRLYLPNLILCVYFYDKIMFGVTTSFLCTWTIRYGTLSRFSLNEYAPNVLPIAAVDQQFERLRQFPLSPGQYFMHYYTSGGEVTPITPVTLCLVQIVDRWVMFSRWRKESRRLFDLLIAYVSPQGPYQRIAIKFQERHFPDSFVEYYYPVQG